jgi:6-phosphofructo-2-kinase
MVGLPARGKSYITKKLARYMNWLQHDTKIFNVGERRRLVSHHGPDKDLPNLTGPKAAAQALMASQELPIPALSLPEAMAPSDLDTPLEEASGSSQRPQEEEEVEQTAEFFDPSNKKAAQIREKCAIDTLDDLLHYILEGDGSVGILDATNSTLARRKLIMERIRAKAGHVNVLFIESVCQDETLLESNMRLKLSGPDYKDKDPVASLMDFKKRVAIYEKNYVPLGDHEESHGMPYVKMIDVGRKVITYKIKGFLSSTAVYYLLNFNLAPRQIWITRHGESIDNVLGKIGGDSELSPNGLKYGEALERFISSKRLEWQVHQRNKTQNTHFPPLPGDTTPPNPYVATQDDETPNYCVWTSMLKRSVQTAQYFNDEDYDVKEMRMLNELYSGLLEGMTYEQIQRDYAQEYALRKEDKLAYRYPGPGGEGYLDVLNRLRQVITELERMTEHCLLITHRSVARVLLAYFRGLSRDEVANLDAPLGMLYCLEPVSRISNAFRLPF